MFALCQLQPRRGVKLQLIAVATAAVQPHPRFDYISSEEREASSGFWFTQCVACELHLSKGDIFIFLFLFGGIRETMIRSQGLQNGLQIAAVSHSVFYQILYKIISSHF